MAAATGTISAIDGLKVPRLPSFDMNVEQVVCLKLPKSLVPPIHAEILGKEHSGFLDVFFCWIRSLESMGCMLSGVG